MTEKKQLTLYMALSYGIAWFGELLMILLYNLNVLPENGGAIHYILVAFLAGLAPTYAAFIVKFMAGYSIKDMIKEDGFWKNKLFSLIILIIFFTIVLGINVFLETKNEWSWFLTPVVFIVMIFGGGLEEVGWRSILQPVLFKKVPFFLASLIQGVLWAIWHFPLWFVKNTSQSSMSFIAFIIYCIVICLMLSVLYRFTKSVFACVCLHAWCNTCQGIFSFRYIQIFPTPKVLLTFGTATILTVIIFFVLKAVRKEA